MSLTAHSYENQEFQSLSLRPQDLCRKEFSNCAFKSCDFGGCEFHGALFSDCVFHCCNLADIKVDNCGFRETSFNDCKLSNVSFTAVNPFLLSWAFKQCKIDSCIFSGLKMKHSRFTGSVIRKTDFLNVDLSASDFSGCDLRESRFHNAVLEAADFTGARNYYIDPANNKIKKAKFSLPEVLSLLAPFDIKVEY